MTHEPIDFDSRPKPAEVEKVHLFTLDGKDYFIPERIRPAVGLRYLYDLKTEGEQFAIAGMLFAVLGQETMNALSSSESVTQDDLKVIMEIVRDRAMGAMEGGNDS